MIALLVAALLSSPLPIAHKFPGDDVEPQDPAGFPDSYDAPDSPDWPEVEKGRTCEKWECPAETPCRCAKWKEAPNK